MVIVQADAGKTVRLYMCSIVYITTTQMKYCLLVLLCAMYTQSFAQTKTNERLTKDFDLNLRFSPLALARLKHHTFLVGVEKKLKSNFSIGADAGYIFRTNYVINTTNSSTSHQAKGFVVRPALRYYVSDRNRFYWEGALTYQFIDEKYEEFLGVNCVNGVPAYFKLTNFSMLRTTADASARFGGCFNLFKSKKLFLEMFAGVGARYRGYKIKSAESNTCYTIPALIGERVVTSSPTTNAFSVIAPGGIRLGYVLR
jgi:hypothetical protein